MFGLLKYRHQRDHLAPDFTAIDDHLEVLLGAEWQAGHKARNARYEADMAEICSFLEAGFTRIAQAQASGLTRINPIDPFAGSETAAVRRAAALAQRQLLLQADAGWGENRVNSALARLQRSRV